MKHLFVLLAIFSLSLLSCSKNVNGKMVNGLYEKGITVGEKKFPLAGYTKEGATVFYLVRHAEKEKKGKDPGLTEVGTDRARKLGKMLASVEISGIYSTNRKRTIYTAAPTAELQKMEVDSYDAKKQKELVDKLVAEQGKNFLIVGHSNTIPALLNLFQTEKVYDHIDESTYDNFYVVVVNGSEDCKIHELKY